MEYFMEFSFIFRFCLKSLGDLRKISLLIAKPLLLVVFEYKFGILLSLKTAGGIIKQRCQFEEPKTSTNKCLTFFTLIVKFLCAILIRFHRNQQT